MTVTANPPRLHFAAKWLYRTSRIAFGMTFLLAMMTPSWRQGTFAQWPLLVIKIQGIKIPVGLLASIPLLSLLAWAAARLVERPRRPLSFGPKRAALAVFGFGLWTLIRMWPIHLKHVAFVTGVSILFFWTVYLYTIDAMPGSWVLASFTALLLFQGLAGTMQFLRQGSIGLVWMGEGQLDPMAQGASVIESAGQRWVRAYGLTAHPNVLGGYLAMCIVICLSAAGSNRRLALPLKWGLWLSLAAGSLGLFFTFSRSAWLGLAAGLAYLAWMSKPWKRLDWQSSDVRRVIQIAAALVLVVIVILSMLYGDLVVTRLIRLKNPLEATSIQERLTDIGQAWSLIRVVPFKGTGSGYYAGALWARVTDPDWKGFRLIHNIPLLVTAELGIQGLMLWLWLILGPPVALAWRQRQSPITGSQAGLCAALVTAFVTSLLDNYLYIPSMWWPALYLGMLLGTWARAFPAQENQERYVDISGGFDLAAGRYDQETEHNPAMAYMRRTSTDTLLAAFQPGQRLLEIGCGTGQEAIALAQAGMSVLATDLSGAMVAITSQKVAQKGLQARVEVRQLPAGQIDTLIAEWGEGAFDGAYSSFGPLNGEPSLLPVTKSLFRLIKPGGKLVVSVMNRFYPLETLWYLLHGHPRQAVRRWSGAVMAGVSPSLPATIPTWYYSPRSFARACRGFKQQQCRALPLLLPPPYLAHLWPRLPKQVWGWEKKWAPRWPFYAWGDHFLMILKRQ